MSQAFFLFSSDAVGGGYIKQELNKKVVMIMRQTKEKYSAKQIQQPRSTRVRERRMVRQVEREGGISVQRLGSGRSSTVRKE